MSITQQIRDIFRRSWETKDIVNERCTAVLFVSPDGVRSDGLTWETAFTTIQDAIAAASTDANALTKIIVAPGDYDIDTVGAPACTANVYICSAGTNWITIANTAVGATYIMQFSGRTYLEHIRFDMGTGLNGISSSANFAQIIDCSFNGQNLTGAATAITLTGQHNLVDLCEIRGEATSTNLTGLVITNSMCNTVQDCRIGFCLVGISVNGAASDYNLFKDTQLCTNATAFQINAGNHQMLNNIELLGNTLNIDDAVGDSIFENIVGQFPVTIIPDNVAGTTVTSAGGANTWGNNTEIRSAAAATRPFKIVGIVMNPAAAQMYRVRLYDGTNYFDDFVVEGGLGVAGKPANAAPGTEFVFNVATAISASCKDSAGGNGINVWVKVQEI